MAFVRTFGKGAFAALLTLSILMWSVMPATSHAPAVFETLQEHAEMVAEHGHSHGLEEDLYWAMHGHSHDSADHDHSPAVLSLAPSPEPFAGYRDLWRLPVSADGPHRVFPIKRPPRV